MSKRTDYNFKNKSILVIEDDITSTMYLDEILKETGAKLNFFSNGLEAFKFFEQNKNIDIVLTDIKLPDISGYELTKAMKKIRKETPVIAQTACVMDEDRKMCFDAGCDFYLAKPLTREPLLNSIARIITN